jgi:hypothetical protein
MKPEYVFFLYQLYLKFNDNKIIIFLNEKKYKQKNYNDKKSIIDF